MKTFCYTLYALVFIICSFSPYDRTIWFVENLPILILIGAVYWVSRHHEFSRLAWALMFLLPILHTIGAHYTFERVPFGWVTNLFGFERNHFDRLAHFSVGFYAFAITELLVAKKLTANRMMAGIFAVFAILSVAASYEIFEWWFALLADPEAGIAVLGSQGDVWDAQKDMLADGLGAICATGLYALCGRK